MVAGSKLARRLRTRLPANKHLKVERTHATQQTQHLAPGKHVSEMHSGCLFGRLGGGRNRSKSPVDQRLLQPSDFLCRVKALGTGL
jgi:hypothetical protein